LSREKKELPEPLSDEIRQELPEPAQEYIEELECELEKAKKEIERLKGQLLMNSLNSSKPPSSDGLKKKPVIPGSQRRSSCRKPGGQPKHSGTTLMRRPEPDHVVSLGVSSCSDCGEDLSGKAPIRTETAQSFDLPKTPIEVTEYRTETKLCPCCLTITRSQFPAGVGAGVSYGPRFKGLALYLMHRQLIPARRVCELLEEIFGHTPSHGSLVQWSESAYEELEDFEKLLVGQLTATEVANFDETGMRCEGSLHWLHSASTEELSFFGIHHRRGCEAMLAFGILPFFRGVAVHDHWDPYFKFEGCAHALCNSHILRELTFVNEVLKEKWAGRMKELLTQVHDHVEQAKERGQRRLNWKTRLQFIMEYEAILQQGYRLHRGDKGQRAAGARGPIKQSKPKNLLDRLRDRNQEILRFMADFRVPFTNNQSEQDIRMNKVKLKISGCFRSFRGAQVYCRIQSYLSTMRKQGQNLLEASQAIFRHQPLMLPT
jgi:transposase